MLTARLSEGRESPPPTPSATGIECNVSFTINESCPEKNDGVIVIYATGGIGPYTYTLGFRSNNTGIFSNLPAGDHIITIKDWLNNEATCDAITITEPDPITASVLSVENETCNEDNDGVIIFEAMGGTPPYTYDNGLETNTTGIFDNLSTGFYRVTITDISSCRGISPIAEVTQPWPLACVVRNVENESCAENNDGLIEINGSGGTAPYIYVLNGVSNTTGVFSNLDAGQYQVEITDANNCTELCNLITVTEGDVIPPSITCPPQMFGVCSLTELPPFNSFSEFVNNGGSANDNVAIDASSFRMVEENIGATTCPIRVSRVYEISDDCGNSARCVQSIMIFDEDPPTLSCPSGGVVECTDDVPVPYSNINDFILDGGNFDDNCGVNVSSFRLLFQSIQMDPSQPNCPVSVTRIYSLSDNCNNSTSCAQVIRIEDNTNPVMNMPASENAICDISEVPPYDYSTFVSSGGSVDDNCEINQASFRYVSEQSDGNSCPETVTREYEISDVCGNIIIGLHRVIINDDVAPSINCPATINVQCDISEIPPYSTLNEFLNANGVVSDNCSIDQNSLSLVSETTDGNSCPETIIRTYAISDVCGLSNTCEQVIIIGDTTRPEIVCPPNKTINCKIDDEPIYTSIQEFINDGGRVTDNCGFDQGSITLISEIKDGELCPIDYERTYEISDNCGNRARCSYRITVVDTEAPLLTNIPGDITLYCENPPEFQKQDCDALPIITETIENVSVGKPARAISTHGTIVGTPGGAVDGNTSATFFPSNGSGTHTNWHIHSWWEVDLLEVEDITDIVLWNDTDCCKNLRNYYILVSDVPFASTNLASTLADPNVTSFFHGGATNLSRSQAVNTTGRYVRIQNNMPGQWRGLSLSEVEVFATQRTVDPGGYCVTDNCTDNVTMEIVEESTQTFDNSCSSVIYQVTRTYIATDDCGNSTAQTQTIDVICECCSDGIDNDGNGQIDEEDANCPCSTPSFKLDCNANQYYFVPPMWRLNRTGFDTPSSLAISTSFGTANFNVRTADGVTYNQNFTVTQGAPLNIPLTRELVATINNNTVEDDTGLIIESDQLIQVVYRLSANLNKAMITIKGEQALGRRFRAGSQSDLCNRGAAWSQEAHFISVMAVEDGTSVTFDFDVPMQGITSPHTVTLDYGETYLIRDVNNTTVSGALITSTRPIAVVSGSNHNRKCLSSGRDSGVDQLVPTCVVGTDYVVTRGEDPRNPARFNYATIVAVSSNTEIFINGSTTPIATLINPGDFYEYRMPAPNGSSTLISTSLPAYVYQHGSLQSNGELGMALAAPIDGCRGDRYVEFSEFPGSTRNIATVIIPDAGLASLTLNGTPYTSFSVAQSVPGLAGWSVVRFEDSDLDTDNVLQSDEYFTASHFVGNSGGGTFGYLTSFKDKIDVFHPETNQPTFEYFVDTICSDQAYEHCLSASSCSGGHFVSNIIQSTNTGALRIFPNSLCFEYTGLDGYTGYDDITVQIADQVGFTQPACLSFFVCGENPSISCPPGETTTCDISSLDPFADYDEFIAAGGTASDDCNLDPSTFRLVSEESNGLTCPEVITRTYGISDECGNESTCEQLIEVIDEEAPQAEDVDLSTAVCSADEIAPIGNFQAYLNAGGSASDNCGIDEQSLRLSEVLNGGGCPVTVTRIYVVSDLCGNTTTFNQVIQVRDEEIPSINCPDQNLATCLIDEIPPYQTLEEFNLSGGNVSDNCLIDASSFRLVSEDSDNGSCPEIITREYEISDICGNSARCIQLIRIQDNEKPSILCPSDITTTCSIEDVPSYMSIQEFIDAGGIISDNCLLQESSFELISEEDNGGLCPMVITRTYKISDACGNEETCTQNIIVNDEVEPIMTCPPSMTTVCSANENPAYTSLELFLDAGGQVSDNCELDSNSFLLILEEIVNSSCPMRINRVYQINDLCGNIGTCTQILEVNDTEDPVLFCPPTSLGDCYISEFPPLQDYGEFTAAGGFATDNCFINEATLILVEERFLADNCPQSYERTYSIADFCGNTGTCVQVIQVWENNVQCEVISRENPTCTGFSDGIIEIGATGCGNDFTFNIPGQSNTDGIFDNLSSGTYTITVTDETGCTSVCPDIELRDPQPLQCSLGSFSDESCTDENNGAITVAASGGTGGYSYSLGSESNDTGIFTRLPAGIYTVTVTDEVDCTTTCTEVILQEGDDRDPIIMCPLGDQIQCDEEIIIYSTLLEFRAAGGIASDDRELDPTSFNFSIDIAETNCPEEYTVTYSIADLCGNTGSCTQIFERFDTDPPVIDCPNDTIAICSVDEIEIYLSLEDFILAGGIASDKCDLDSTSFTHISDISDDVICPETITRTYSIADICGNTAICTMDIVINDEEDPAFANTPEDVTVSCEDIPEVAEITATDNCVDVPVIIFSEVSNLKEVSCETFRSLDLSTINGFNDNTTIVNQAIDGNLINSSTFNANLGSNHNSTYSLNSRPSGFANGDLRLGNNNNSEQSEIYFSFDEPINIRLSQAEISGAFELLETWNISSVGGSGLYVNNPIIDITTSNGTNWNDTELNNVSGNGTHSVTFNPKTHNSDGNISVEDSEWEIIGYGITELTINLRMSNPGPNASRIKVSVDCIPFNISEDGCLNEINRTWLVIDDCGNSIEHTQVIIVEDNEDPTFDNAPEDITILCTEAIPTYVIIATDTCDDDVEVIVNTPVSSQTMDGSETDNCYTITNSWVASDNCGNSIEHTQIITIQDIVAPAFTNAPVDDTIECTEAIPTYTVAASDNCDTDVEVIMFDSVSTQAANDCYTITRSWRATDNCGNTLEHTQVLTIEDNVAPAFTNAPANETIECTDEIIVPVLTAQDNCDLDVMVVMTGSGSTLTSDGSATDNCYEITRTWTATDNCGNTVEHTQIVTVEDNIAPVYTNAPSDETIECTEAIPTYIVVATDNCDTDVEVILIDSISTQTANDCYTIKRTWRATDNCGNSLEHSQVITIEDNIDPAFTNAPVDETIECTESVPTYTVVATDNCDINVDVVLVDSVSTQAGNDCYTITRSWTATDNCGNSIGHTQVLTIEDNVAPTFTNAPADETIECSEAVIIPVLTAIDNCDLDVMVVLTGSGSTLTSNGSATDNCYEITRTWTATDNCGNTDIHTQIVTVIDTISPVFVNTPADQTIECTFEIPTYSIQANDNCDNDITIVQSDSTSTQDANDCYTISRTWTATDNCGNTELFTHLLTVIDTLRPMFVNAPADQTIECSDEILVPTVIASDNCDLDVMVAMTGSGSTLTSNGSATDNCYEITRTWTATDNCGNTELHTQIVTVIDTISPTFTVTPSDVTIECSDEIPSYILEANDNCDDNLSIELTDSVSTQTVDGTETDFCFNINRTWTVTDNCGNTQFHYQMTTIQDTEIPIITCISDTTFVCDLQDYPPYNSIQEFLLGGGLVADNCSIDSLSFDHYGDEVDGNTCPAIVTRTYHITDMCGNTNTCTQIINVNDEVTPEFTVTPDDITINCGDTIPVYTFDATDNCDTDIVITRMDSISTQTFNGTSTDVCFEITRRWIATDNCGNTDMHTQILTVIDDIDPEFINTPADHTIECTEAIPVYTLQAIDNCDNNVSIALTDSTSTQANNDCFEISRTWTATDKCGNTDVFTQAITIIDTIRPTFANAPSDLTIECTESIPTYILNATDNCDQIVDVELIDSISTQASNECYTITRSWIATDNCGNSEIATQVLTIIDTIAPVFVNTPADASIACTDAIPTFEIMASDNCDTDVEIIMTDSTSTQAANDCYTITRTWRATDNCGNSEIFTHDLEITDNINPVFTNAPLDATIECTDVIPTFDVVATDNCDLIVEVILQDSVSTQSANDCFEITRTWVATDNCGNSISHTQLTTVIDTIRPVFVATPADNTIECTESIPSFTIEATDNCDQVVDIVLSDSTSTQVMNDCYEISRTWTATDNCGNSETFTHILTIVDDVQPTFVNAPSDETITCVDGIPSYVLIGQDNCDTNVIITLIDSVSNQTTTGALDDNCFEITRTWRATDNCGNTDIHSQTVTMADDINPSITCPDDVILTCIDQLPAPFNTLIEFENAGGIVSDNCVVDAASFSLVSDMSDGLSCPETITREYSIADQCGNTAICAYTITVHDTIPPTIVCMDTIIADCIIEEIDIYTSITEFEIAGGSIDDNCGIVEGSFTHIGDSSDGNTCPEIITRTYEVADSCGNISVCESYIVVRPNTLVCTVESTMDETCDYLDNGQIIVSATGCTGIYTYDNGTTTNTDGIFNDLPAGVYSITVTDDAGCTSICDGIVISEPETLTCNVDSVTPETCTSGNDGSLSVTATGGTAPYSFSLNDSTNNTGIFSNLDAGTYSVIIRDANDCETTCTEIIIENDYTTEVITNLVQSFCDGDSILVANSVYFDSGIYSDTLVNYIGCDSIINLDLTVHSTYDIDSTVVLCEGQSIMIGTSTYNQTGMYTDELTTAQGCDSIINLDLTVHPLLYDTLDITLCEEDTINFNGTVYNTAGTYDYTTTSSLNCDSTVTLELTYIATERTSETIEICEGDSALIAGVYYLVPSSVSDTLPASSGCDSIHITTLIVNPVHSDTITQFICDGDSILIDNQYEYTAGFYPEVFTNQYGCDSTVTIELMINPIYTVDLEDSICEGDSILIGNVFATTAGIYPDTLQTVAGCDSILLVDLTIHPVYDITLTDTICSNTSISFGDSTYNTTGLHEYNTLSIYGCDSTVFLDLTVLLSPVTDLYVDRCQGETFFVAGQLQFETGDYTEVYTAANGCDSTVITHLTIHPLESTQIEVELCEGQSVLVGENEIFESGIYTDTLATTFGCDSILFYNVAIVDYFFSEREVVVCEGASYFVGGAYQFEPGIYYDTLSTSSGCDSIILTQLDMDDKLVQVVNESICYGDSILLGGAYQTTSNVYVDSLIANGGCDSIVFTVLDILSPNTTNQSFTLCYGDSLSVGTSIYTTSGIHIDTLVAHNGCDSIITTDLYIRDEIITNLEFDVCFGDSITVNGEIYTSFGVYTDTLNATNGCDSLLVIEIDNLSDAETVFRDTICQGDMVMFGGQPYNTSGSYTDNFATVGGCDSISTLNLIVLATDTSYTSLTMCQGSSMEYNDFTITNPGDYTFLLAAANGCDSVEILTVETIDILRDTVDVTLCLGDTIFIDGLPYTQEGWVLETLESVNTDCDSLVYYNVSMVPDYEFTNTITICVGDSALIEGVYYTEAGIYTSEYNTQYGCDSTIITELFLEDVVTFVSADTTVCQGDPVTLEVIGASFVTWSPSEGLSCSDCPNPTATPDVTTTYTAFAETCLGEIEEYDITVTVNPVPVITTELVVNSVIGQTVVLTADVNDFTSTLVWTNEAGEVLCTNCYSLEVTVTEEISLYYVTATSIAGCDATASIDLVAQDLCDEGEVEVPNFITPNNDGANDEFEIRYNNIKELGVLRIYNRWGELVYETDNPTYDFWDGTFRGKELNPGVYVYYLEVFCLDDNQFLKKGNVTIIK